MYRNLPWTPIIIYQWIKSLQISKRTKAEMQKHQRTSAQAHKRIIECKSGS